MMIDSNFSFNYHMVWENGQKVEVEKKNRYLSIVKL